MAVASHLVCCVPHPFAGPLKQNGKTCSLVSEITKVSEECFLELECGEECETLDEKKCNTVQEQQCRTVQEQQCDVVQVRTTSFEFENWKFKNCCKKKSATQSKRRTARLKLRKLVTLVS